MKKTLLLFITLLTVTITNAQLVAGDTFEDSLFKYTVSTDAEPGSPNTVSITGTVDGATIPNDLVIPASVNEGGFDYAIKLIASQSFKGTSITSVLIEGDTEAGYQSFMDCTSLTTVSMPLSSGAIGAQAFRNCSALSSVNVPNILLVGVQSFRLCTSLEHIDLPSATSIGASSTQGLSFWSSGLKTINMPVMDSIAVGTFNASKLTSITLPASITKLSETNYNMFRNITTLTQVIVEGSTPLALVYSDPGVATSSIFNSVLSTATLTVPNGAFSAYQNATVWQDFSSIVEAAPLSVDDKEAALGWAFYPNPANDVVSITNNQANNAAITVYDLNGRALLNKTINSVESKINISNLHTGIYLFNVTTDKGSFTKRIVKQ